MAEMSTRHNNFGTTIAVPRSTSGTHMIISNVFKKNIDLNVVGSQKSKPKPKKGTNVIEAEQTAASQVNFFEDDPKIKTILEDFAIEFLEHSFSPLIECVHQEFVNKSPRLEAEDPYRFMSLCSFMVEFWRLKAAEKQQKAKDEYKFNNPGKPIPQVILILIFRYH